MCSVSLQEEQAQAMFANAKQVLSQVLRKSRIHSSLLHKHHYVYFIPNHALNHEDPVHFVSILCANLLSKLSEQEL